MRYAVPLTLATLLFAPSFAFAHKMIVAVKVTSTVHVEVGYEDETPATETKVTVTDEAGVVVAEGTTDAKGVCVLPRPKPGAYTLVANDGGGHRSRESLIIPDEESPVEAQTASNNRWIMSAAGLAIIGGATLLVWWLRTRR